MRPVVTRSAFLIVALVVLAACGDRFHSVMVRNETNRPFTLFLEFSSPTDGYGSAVSPNAEGMANEPGVGEHPRSFTLYDESCRPVWSGVINSDEVLIVIGEDGVQVGELVLAAIDSPSFPSGDCRPSADD
jgi:hypothetical protein